MKELTLKELAGSIDLTLLKPDATERDIELLVESGLKYPFASVCVPPCHVGAAARLVKDKGLSICTVAGFPLGYQAPGVKLLEAKRAFEEGASEVDMVMNISLFKSGKHFAVEDEISAIVRALPDVTVKVIIETGYLTNEEKIAACRIAINGGADYVKTSTGFGTGGAEVSDIRLLSIASGGKIKVKASGGIKSLADAIAMMEAGAERVGTSSGVKIIEEFSKR